MANSAVWVYGFPPIIEVGFKVAAVMIRKGKTYAVSANGDVFPILREHYDKILRIHG